jgi:hypothetical protein
MNHRIFLFLIATVSMLLMSNLCQAQTKVGIKGGFNASTISFDNLPDRSERYGYHLGLLLDVPLILGFLSVQPEISFSTKGVNYEYLGDKRSIKMNSMDLFLPASFKLDLISIEVGPFVSYLVEKPAFTTSSNKTIIVNGFNQFDAGLSAGLSVNLNRFFISLRYNQGLTNVSNDEIIAAIGKGRNAVGQVSIGLWL